MEDKKCSKCQTRKPLLEFPRNRAHKGGYGNYCKPCNNAHRSAHLATPRGRELNNSAVLKHRSGVVVSIYNRLFEEQEGLCFLCKEPETISTSKNKEKINRPSIDHDHSCCPYGSSCEGCIRGLLCMVCNTFLNKVDKENSPLRIRFEDYLTRRPLRNKDDD